MARRKLGRNWGEHIIFTDDVSNKKVKVLLSGGPGSGKTTFCTTAPNPFFIATEDGLLTAHAFHFPAIKLTDDMEVFESYLQILDAARNKAKIQIGEDQYVDFAEIETLCLDSVWMLNTRLKKEILESGVIRNAQKDLWGVLLDQIKDCILKLLDMDYHVIATVGEAIKTDEMDSDAKVISYNFQGSFRNEIGYLFDFNLYMVKEERGRNMTYKCYTNDENKRSAKARISGLPKEIVNPTFQMLLDHLNKIKD